MPASGSGHSILRPHPQLIHSGEDFTDIPKARPHHSHQGSDSSWVVVPQPGVLYLHFRLHVLLTASLCLEGSSCLVTSSSLDFVSDGFFLPRSDHHIAVTTPQYTAVLCTSFPFPSLAVMRNCESNLKWGGYWVLFFSVKRYSVVIFPGYSQICDKAAMAEEYGKGELLTSWHLGRKEKGGAQFLVYLSRVNQ